MIFASLNAKMATSSRFKWEKTSFCCAIKEAKVFLKMFHLVGVIMRNTDIKVSFYQCRHLIPIIRKFELQSITDFVCREREKDRKQ